jgi:uncharacterized protein (TIGR02147 family)
MPNKISIYSYSDYRQYLLDFITWKQEKNPRFSRRALALKCGFSSLSYLTRIIQGTRNPTPKSTEQLVNALKLRTGEAKQFRLLVQYAQTDNIERQQELYKEISRNQNRRLVQTLNNDHIDYFSKWYYPVIRHLAVHSQWNGDYRILASLVEPRIAAQQAQDAVTALERMGLLIFKNNKYSFSQKALNLDNLPRFAREKGRKDILLNGINSLEQFPEDERYAACSLMSISGKAYKEIIEILSQARRQALQHADHDDNPEQTSQMAMLMFPYTKNFGGQDE